MRLHEYKTRAMTLLMTYQPRNEKERQFVEMTITKLHTLRTMNMPDFLMNLYFALREPEFSTELKDIVRKMIEAAAEVVSAQVSARD